MNESRRFHEILRELGDLHDKKQQDYGSEDDPFANIRASQEFGIPSWIGALVRLNDKIIRLKSFARKGSLANESVEDSLRDIAVYATIALVLYEQDSSTAVTVNPPIAFAPGTAVSVPNGRAVQEFADELKRQISEGQTFTVTYPGQRPVTPGQTAALKKTLDHFKDEQAKGFPSGVDQGDGIKG